MGGFTAWAGHGSVPPWADAAVTPPGDARDRDARGTGGWARVCVCGCRWRCCLSAVSLGSRARPCRVLAVSGSVLDFLFSFSHGVEFSFCFPKAGSKACAIMVFVPVSAPHPQQWRLKFGSGYMCERYTHFCTFYGCKWARQFSRQLRETRQVPQASPQPPTAHAPCSPHAAEQAAWVGMGETSALWNSRASSLLGTRVFSVRYEVTGKQTEEIDASQGDPPIPPHWASPSFVTGVLDVPGPWDIPDWGFLRAYESFTGTRNGWEVASGKQSYF